MKVGIHMIRNIIEPQKSDMGSGAGEYLFSDGTTLGDFLKWYKENSKTWGEITIIYNDGRILRKFDYDLYNNNICYTERVVGFKPTFFRLKMRLLQKEVN